MSRLKCVAVESRAFFFHGREEKWIASSLLCFDLEPRFLIRLELSSATVLAMLLLRVMLSGVPVPMHIFNQGDVVTSFFKSWHKINNTSNSVWKYT